MSDQSDQADPHRAARRRPAAGQEVRTEIEIRRSRFLTLLRRAESVDEARALVADARAEFPDARHHCAAWIVSEPGAQPLQHSSDDGEPAGTAGRPMLDVLDGAGLIDIAVVVVRYFGGVLLGTGGLVRAYSDAVTEALEVTRWVRPVDLEVVRVSLPHAPAARFEAEVRGLGREEVLSVDYDAHGATFRLATPDAPALRTLLAELSGATAQAIADGTVTVDRPAR